MDRKSSVGKLLFRGASIELVGYVAAQVFRLSSTLILSRLLFPEAFGVAAIVTICTQGLVMLSDAGIEQSVVRDQKGVSLDFLHTAWTISVVRGCLLWLLAALSSIPLSVLYDAPELRNLIPVGAVVLFLSGLNSTKLYLLRRDVNVGPLVTLELISQLSGIVITIVVAYFDPNVWALIYGSIVTAGIKTLGSFVLAKGQTERLFWDKSAARSIFSFGKWILASSSLSFVAKQSDRLIMGVLVGPATLGVYSMAVYISEALGMAILKITSGVLYPILAGEVRERKGDLVSTYYATRLQTDLLGLIPAGAVFALSQQIVDILFDDRYSAAGWMLSLLSIRVAMSLVVESIQNCLFALGNTRYGFVQNSLRSICILIGLPIGWSFVGTEGVIWAIVLSEIAPLLFVWRVFAQLQYIIIVREALSFVIFAFGILVGMLVSYPLEMFITSFDLVKN